MERHEYILCITEGECLEKDVLALMDKYVLKSKIPLKIISYKTDIYNLYKEIKEDAIKNDDILDTLEFIKGIIEQQHNKTTSSSLQLTEEHRILSTLTEYDISQIFLFFDYDGHINNHKLDNPDEVIHELLSFFDNKKNADRGKLYISYPMAEAFKDTCFESNTPKTTPIHLGKEYKSSVNKLYSGKHFETTCNEQTIYFIFSYHLKSANFLNTGSFKLPMTVEGYKTIANQTSLFNQQKIKYIDTNKSVLVLSAFPLFVVEYFKEERLQTLIQCLS